MAYGLLVRIAMARGHAAFGIAGGLAEVLEPEDDVVPTQVTPRPESDDLLPTTVTARGGRVSLGCTRVRDIARLPDAPRSTDDDRLFHYVVESQPRIPVENRPALRFDPHHTPYGFQVPLLPPVRPSSSSLLEGGITGELGRAVRELRAIWQGLSAEGSPPVSTLYQRALTLWTIWEWNPSDFAWAGVLGTLVFVAAAGVGIGVVARPTDLASGGQELTIPTRAPHTLEQHTARAPSPVRGKRR